MHLGKLYTAKTHFTLGQAGGAVLYSFMRWSVRCGHKEAEERVRKTIFILFMGPKDRRHTTQSHLGTHQVVRRLKTGTKEALRPWLLMGFLQKRQGRWIG